MVQEIQAKLKGIETVSDISGYLTGFLRCYGIPNATLARLGLDNSVPVDQSINMRLRAHVWVGNSLCLP